MNPLPYINAFHSLLTFGGSFFSRRYAGQPGPVALSVELTNRCNLHCPECVTGSGSLTRPQGFMTLATAEEVAREVRRTVLSTYLYFQGEPMMHPQFFEIAELFRGLGSVISTNGHFLSEENCHRLAVSGLRTIKVSYDGVTQPVYSSYRSGGDINVVTEGVKRLAAMLKVVPGAPALELVFLYGRHNEHEAGSARLFARSVGAAMTIKTMQVIHPQDTERWLPSDERLSRYRGRDDQFVIKSHPSRGCLRAWTTGVVTWDGMLIPCCFDKNAEYAFGDIKDEPLMKIWNGSKRKEFVLKLLGSGRLPSLCSNCPKGLRITY